jgi:hypothetical protein
MIKVTITPKSNEDVYGLLIQKERTLRFKNQGTLHRAGPKRKDREKWAHSSYYGWIQFQRCLGGVTVAVIQSKNADSEWQLLTSFIGFLDRHFRDKLVSITLTYDEE